MIGFMTEIIAEIAQGYEGRPDYLYLLAKGACAAGADAVKAQVILADELAVPGYQYYELFQQLEMPDEAWERFAKVAKDNGCRVYCDVYGPQSVAVAKAIGADGVKISTTDFNNRPLIRSAIESFDRVFISIGGVPLDEVRAMESAVGLKQHAAKITFMYGFQSEPTPIGSNNLSRIAVLKGEFPEYRIGFMDHIDGADSNRNLLGALSVALGAGCVEKHISLERALELEDFVSALSVEEFREFVGVIRCSSDALGSSSLELTDAEHAYRAKASKAVLANRDLKAGTVVEESDIVLKRPRELKDGDCVIADEVLGRAVKRDVAAGETITREDLNA